MKFHIGMCLEPFLVPLMGAEVVENDVKLSVRKCCGHAIHEVEKLDPATSLRMRRKDLPGSDFQRCKQRGRAMLRIPIDVAQDSEMISPTIPI